MTRKSTDKEVSSPTSDSGLKAALSAGGKSPKPPTPTKATKDVPKTFTAAAPNASTVMHDTVNLY